MQTWLRLTLYTLLAICLYLTARIGIGAYFTFQANQAGQQQKMVKRYQLQQKALVFNPWSAIYHRSYALTNLALTIALTSKTDLTKQEQAQLPELIKQAVRETKTATRLRPQQTLNWQVQGQVYANLIGAVPEADQFAVQAYLKAIKLEPDNAELLFNLSKIFYQTQDFPQAQKLLTQSLELTPNQANALYYLAHTHRQQKNYSVAIETYEQLLNLLEPGTADYQTAEAELTTTRALQATGSADLSTPESLAPLLRSVK